MRSLRRQLLRTLTLTLLAVFITQGFVLYGALVHLANSQTLLHLSHDSESVLSAIDVDGQGQLTLTSSGWSRSIGIRARASISWC